MYVGVGRFGLRDDLAENLTDMTPEPRPETDKVGCFMRTGEFYSSRNSPLPPQSLGMSFSFGRPSLIGSKAFS